MAFASTQKNGGPVLTPRTVVKPLSVNTTSSKSIAASPTSTASPSARPKSGSPSPSSTAHHRRTSSGSAGKNGSDHGGIFIGMFYITIMYRNFCSHFTTMCVISKGRIPARAVPLDVPWAWQSVLHIAQPGKHLLM
jgi:hypothetical protein